MQLRGLFLMLLGCLTLAPAPAMCADYTLELLKAMQDRGYGDTAVELLDKLQASGQLPPDLVQTLDLEKAKSLRAAARHAYNVGRAEQLVLESQKHLDKFLREHKTHPAVATATLASADFYLDKAIEAVIRGKAVSNQAEQATALAEARTSLAACRPKFNDALQKFNTQKAGLKPVPPPDAKGRYSDAARKLLIEENQIDLGIVECQLKLAMISYQLAQTYVDPKSAERIKYLQAAYDEFDGIFLRYTGSGEVKLHAHLWKGRAAEDQGKYELALDIYDEVLVMEPTGPAASLDAEPFYSQVFVSRLKLLAKQKQLENVVREAETWLADHKNWSRAGGYQGVVLELAKAQIALAQSAKPDQKKKQMSEAVALLNNASRIESPYQGEIILLRRQHNQLAPGQNAAFEELMTFGREFGSEENWPKATESFTQALELAQANKNTKEISLAKGMLRQVRLRVAYAANKASEFEEALRLSRELAREDLGDTVAPAAASLALDTSVAVHAKADEKGKAAARAALDSDAKFILDNWPASVEADKTRMLLAELEQQSGNLDASLAMLATVKPESRRYGASLYAAGQLYRYQLRAARKAEPVDAVAVAKLKAQAIKQLQAAIVAFQSTVADDNAKRLEFEAQLQLGYIHMDDGEFDKALAIYEPLYETARLSKPNAIEVETVQVYAAIAKAYIGAGQLPKSVEVAESLLRIGGDVLEINEELVRFTRLFDLEIRKANAAVSEAETNGDFSGGQKAKAIIAGCQEVQGKLVDGILPRKNLTAEGMVYLADTASSLGMNQPARDTYNRVLDKANKEPEFAKNSAKALTRVRSRLVGLLREEGNYEQAMAEVEQLIADNPRSLEPLVEKATIMQAWAQNTKDNSKYDACIAQWTRIRVLLQRMPERPPEYYDAIYNAAFCLLEQSDKRKALQAEQLLKNPLTLSPDLNGPDTVAKFKALLKRAQDQQAK